MRKSLGQLRQEALEANRLRGNPASAAGAWEALTTWDKYRRALQRDRFRRRGCRDPL